MFERVSIKTDDQDFMTAWTISDGFNKNKKVLTVKELENLHIDIEYNFSFSPNPTNPILKILRLNQCSIATAKACIDFFIVNSASNFGSPCKIDINNHQITLNYPTAASDNKSCELLIITDHFFYGTRDYIIERLKQLAMGISPSIQEPQNTTKKRKTPVETNEQKGEGLNPPNAKRQKTKAANNESAHSTATPLPSTTTTTTTISTNTNTAAIEAETTAVTTTTTIEATPRTTSTRDAEEIALAAMNSMLETQQMILATTEEETTAEAAALHWMKQNAKYIQQNITLQGTNQNLLTESMRLQKDYETLQRQYALSLKDNLTLKAKIQSQVEKQKKIDDENKTKTTQLMQQLNTTRSQLATTRHRLTDTQHQLTETEHHLNWYQTNQLGLFQKSGQREQEQPQFINPSDLTLK